MENVIELRNVDKEFKVLNRHEGLKGSFQDLFSRDYKIIKAVNDVSMTIKPGEIVGYLGPNGAGKSTTIKMMTGVLQPTRGEILVNGKVPYKNRTANAQNIGVVFGQRSQLWWSLPLIESFKLLKDIYNISDKDYKDMLTLYESLVDIKDLYSKPVRQMSLGQRTLSDILAAFLHNPPIVFLDEPTIGLDVSMKAKIRNLIKALNKEKNTTVILTTHDMGDVDALCERIVIIDKGTMLYDNDIEHLRSFFGAYRTLLIKTKKHPEELTDDEKKAELDAVEAIVKEDFADKEFTFSSTDEGWCSILIDESQVRLMKVLNHIQEKIKVYDVRLEEISTESVIRKIYEDAENMKKAN
ncbi:MAG: ATP-binding cassette domain-containing protein [Lachnospiraceae bacterium]|jgi:ABC-2 type transport system ATP-binding protein|nr:ATP-binding cassette domain-containing protein [Lachnospiraceae bacterium]